VLQYQQLYAYKSVDLSEIIVWFLETQGRHGFVPYNIKQKLKLMNLFKFQSVLMLI